MGAGILSLSIDTTKPVAFKMHQISFNKINLIVGTNASGKSFIMKKAFVLGYIGQLILAWGPKTNKDVLLQCAQGIMKGCFSNFDTDGKVGLEFEGGALLTVTMENGKVLDIEYSDFDKLDSIAPMIYMSTQMRTFDAIHLYLKSKKLTALHTGLNGEALLNAMVDDYKLYDVVFIERLLQSIPITLDPTTKEKLKDFGVKDLIKSINVDLDKSEFYAIMDEDNSRRPLTSFSSGEQSIINMVISSVI